MTKHTLLWSGVALAGLAMGCVQEDVQLNTQAQRRECPKEWTWDTLDVDRNRIGPIGPELSGPGPIQNVPEFHDCQRFLVMDSVTKELHYDSLFAIFATSRPGRLDTLALLDTLSGDSLRDTLVSLSGLKGDEALPSAEIWADGNDYDTLGIGAGFNCLYLYRQGGRWAAKMVKFHDTEQDCSRPADTTMSGPDVKPLDVSETGHGLGTVPKVARWDWDDERQEHLIGIYCGEAWCEVARPGIQGPPSYWDRIGKPSLSPGRTRVFGIKGWYDEQYLATLPAAGTRARPTVLVGTIIPDPSLGEISDPAVFDSTWVPAAQVALRVQGNTPNPYRDKLNLSRTLPTPNARLNLIDLCHGKTCEGLPSANQCSAYNDWWARITRADDGNQMYRCVERCDMQSLNIPIPGTARWRWLANDEKSWMRCAQGCCEMR
jgi:hypothetical protein